MFNAKSDTNKKCLSGGSFYSNSNAKRIMAWFNRDVTPERELAIEVAAREMSPREAHLFKTLMGYQDMLQAAVHEIMRLEFLVEDLQEAIDSTKSQS